MSVFSMLFVHFIRISKNQYQEFEIFRQNSNSEGIEYLFLDASPKQNKQIIEKAVRDNKLLVLEANSGVMMDNYIKQCSNGYTNAYNVYKEAIKIMFNIK